MSTKSPLVLIAGSRGYLGSNVFDFLSSRGFKVGRINRIMSGQFISDFSIEVNNQLVDKKSEFLKQEIVFVNAAMLFTRSHSVSDVLPQVSGNIGYPAVIIDFLSRHSSRVKVINLTSYWKYWFDECHGSKNFYSATQKAFDEISHFFLQRNNVEVIELVCGDIFGRNDFRPKIIPTLVQAGLSRRLISVLEPASVIEPVFVDDISRAIFQLIDSSSSLFLRRFQRFSIFGDEMLIVGDVVQKIESLLEVRIAKERVEMGSAQVNEKVRPWRYVGIEIANFNRANLDSALIVVIDSFKIKNLGDLQRRNKE